MLSWLPRATAVGAGLAFVLLGGWAMLGPTSFFESVARFDPYNQHFLQDIGAFQIGLGAVLLLAGVLAGADALATALVGAGVGAALHVVSHVVGADLGGNPATDIPVFTAIAILVLAGGVIRWRSVR
ncbi:MAG: hypothetical protein M3406_11300 [Chloroflexota bacterium]|nr:hypothetical protein [Chloroflexota bacterium]